MLDGPVHRGSNNLDVRSGGGGDSKIAVYSGGCACPPAGVGPIACDDDSVCAPEAEVRFDVVCGQEYLIQIGSGVDLCWQGEFLISCEGDPCEPPGTVECLDCFTKAPQFTGFPGTVAVVTKQPSAQSDGIQVIDITNQASAPSNANWFGAPFYPTANQNWSMSEIGTVFGAALDDDGNIYVAHTSVYGDSFNQCGGTLTFGDALGSLSGNQPGAIYKVSTSTGLASLLVTLPNLSDPAYVGGSYPQNGDESYPGLGNIAFDGATKNLYVSNHEDGAIYRVTKSGTVLNAWLHRTGTVHAGNAVPNAGPGFVDLGPDPTTDRGQRVWAVQPHGGRLYYSVWREDNCPSRVDPIAGNEVWSVDLVDSGPNAGDFIAGSEQLEIDMASYPFTTSASGQSSSPISDIAFTPDCCMLLSERSMINDTISDAHESRLLEFCPDLLAGGGWVPSPNLFQPGQSNASSSSAGGVAFDFDLTDALVNVWSMTDAIRNPNPAVYGLLGMPSTGGSPANGIWIDTDQDISFRDKWKLGDVEVSCPMKCGGLNLVDIRCVSDGNGWTGCWDYTFTITNNSGVDVHYILIADPNVDRHLIWLPNPVPNGQTSDPVTVRICDATAVGCYPLHLSLADANRETCCVIDECVELPDCSCIEMLDVLVDLEPPGNDLNYSLSFSFQNMTADVLEHMFISADPPGSFVLTPDYFDLPTILPGSGVVGPFKVSVGFLAPGTEYCILVSVHNENLDECCSKQICFRTPGMNGWPECAVDLNRDGLLDLSDVTLFISAFVGGQPVADFAAPFGVFDLADVVAFTTQFTAGCP